MKVHIVCYEEVNAWILGKFARRLCENLQRLGIETDITKVPDPHADINHHIIYFDYDGRKTTTETVMVTHIDTAWKLERLKSQLINAEMGICSSSDTVNKLALLGLPRDKLCFVNPAHDEVIKPRKIIIGITSKVQPSGCKREYILSQLADRISLSDFKFKIMGAGWETIINSLIQKGIEVDYFDHFDYNTYCELMPNLDYYLYMGQDEGSMGFIDALAAGIPTIVTPQGFHLDAPGGITYAFNDVDELEKIFFEIAEQKKSRVQSVSSWTWLEYARKHLLIWEYILNKKNSQPISDKLYHEFLKLTVTTTVPIQNKSKQDNQLSSIEKKGKTLLPVDYTKLKKWEEQIADETKKISDIAISLLPDNGVLIDIGSNTGLFTEQVLQHKNCKAYLFEPVPEYYQYSAEKFKENKNITVENYALSDTKGEFSLWVDHSNLGWNTFEGEKKTPGMKEIIVNAITFDEYAEAHAIDRIDVIKIDVEGAEYKVLEGMKKTLNRLEKKPYILCEIGWGPQSHPNWDEEVEMFEWLFQNGYERFDYNVPCTTDVVIRPAEQKSYPQYQESTIQKPYRPRILLIADFPNWIFERHCKILQRFLSDEFDFTMIFQKQPYNEDDFDLIYSLEWNLVKSEQIRNPVKYITGIRSHLFWPDWKFSDFVHYLSSNFHKVHVVSKRLLDIFKPFLPNVAYVTHGVDTTFFTPSTSADQSGKNLRLGWAGNRKSSAKGFEQFVEPLGNLPGVELVFCGYSDRMLSIEEMHDFYNSIDAYICTSDTEGNNNPLLEAASMERAIITTDVGTVSEYLRNDESALIVPRDLQSFKQAVEALRDNPEKRVALGKAARTAVVNGWDWKTKAEDYRRFFREAIAFANQTKARRVDDSVCNINIAPMLQKADTLFAQGNLNAACTAIKEALVLAPNDLTATLAHGNILFDLGEYDAALQEYVKGTMFHPDNFFAHINLAAAQLLLRHTNEAESSVRRALAINPKDTDALKLLAQLCLNGERYEEAGQIFKNILEQEPNDEIAMMGLADFCTRAGDMNSAQIMYEQVLKQHPLNSEAKEALRRLGDEILPSAQISFQKEVRPNFKIGMAVLAHERPEYLEICLDTLFQTNLYDYDITFLIQDDGSTNPSVREIIERARAPRYKIIRSYTPKGNNSWGAAFNKAMRKLLELDDFDIIGSCDCDALFHPEWLDQTMKVCLWAKKNHGEHILGPFSSFNSSDFEFHRILGTYSSPYGNYVVKVRMGALNYFYFKDDLLKLGLFEEHRDDETLMTQKFEQRGIRNFSTETSFVEHIGQDSVLNKWRPTPVYSAVYGIHLVKTGWPPILSQIGTMGYFKYVHDNESIKPGVRSNIKLDILIPVIEKDLEILPLTIDSVRQNLKHPIGRIIVVAPDSDKIKAVCTSTGCEFLSENNLLSINKKDIHYTVNGFDRSGWLFQQFIKLSCNTICSEEYSLVMDADTILLRPQVFEVNGKIVLLHSDEHHQPYFELYKRLFCIDTKTALSFVSHQMLFKKSFLKEFKQQIEAMHGDYWLAVLLKNNDFSIISGMSEYELFGQWMLHNHSDIIIREYFFNISLKRSMYTMPGLRSQLSELYRSLSFHDYNTNTPEISFMRSTPISMEEIDSAKKHKTIAKTRENYKSSIISIFFSKDRAMQLDAALRSFLLLCKDAGSVDLNVIYTTSNDSNEKQYQNLRNNYTSVEFIPEKSFHGDVLSLLHGRDYVVFLVDDNIFVKDFSMIDIVESLRSNPDALGFSLRLGKNTTYCYPLDQAQRLPGFEGAGQGILKYNWTTAELDFGYPLEVSSSMYRAENILPFINRLPFDNPNTLEGIMAANKAYFQKERPFLLCFEQSVTFCAPMNKVQTVAAGNRANNAGKYSVENLARLYDFGYRIDVASYKDLIPNACHQEVELKLTITSGKDSRLSVTISGIDEKINLQDVTFNIPIRYDTVSRIHNITTVLTYLTGNFDTNIIVIEEDSSQKIHTFITRFLSRNVVYKFIKSDNDFFYRTRLLNIMAKESKTSCIVNYDADIILTLNQYIEAYNKIKNNELDLCTPFDSFTYHVPKQLHKRIEEDKDINWLTPDQCYCPHRGEVAKGGVVFWNKQKFIECGMENEHFISWGPEDKERVVRAEKLGLRWGRVKGPLYHLEHDRQQNSWSSNPFFNENNLEFEKILRMNPQELMEYIKTWEWVK